VVCFLVVLHFFFLHIDGRSNPLGIPGNVNKVPFHYYFRAKDRVVYFLFFFVFLVVTLVFGYDLMDAEN
jgi:ubiquinol-cytochrome c reductase cytochrome b subunit